MPYYGIFFNFNIQCYSPFSTIIGTFVSIVIEILLSTSITPMQLYFYSLIKFCFYFPDSKKSTTFTQMFVI